MTVQLSVTVLVLSRKILPPLAFYTAMVNKNGLCMLIIARQFSNCGPSTNNYNMDIYVTRN